MRLHNMRLLVAVGSRADKTCSIGYFARSEARAMKNVFDQVDIVEPDQDDEYPVTEGLPYPDVIFFHAPSLHDRKKPWNAIWNAIQLRFKFPKAVFVSMVHEFSEAPTHWKIRQIALLKLSSAAVVNTKSDFEGVHPFKRKTLRSTLGPTLSFDDLVENQDMELLKARCGGFRTEMSEKYGLSPDETWVLHPGLVTPGKGVDTLNRLMPVFIKNQTLIIMGGIGPKNRDIEFASQVIESLQKKTSGHTRFIQSPSDEDFSKMLLAADLVVLPYDLGLSGRRSSFLSAVSCGANIWTTVGVYSEEMNIDDSGAHYVRSKDWLSGEKNAFESLKDALNESKERRLDRRVKNLRYASLRTWKKRVRDIAGYFEIF